MISVSMMYLVCYLIWEAINWSWSSVDDDDYADLFCGFLKKENCICVALHCICTATSLFDSNPTQ